MVTILKIAGIFGAGCVCGVVAANYHHKRKTSYSGEILVDSDNSVLLKMSQEDVNRIVDYNQVIFKVTKIDSQKN